MFFSPNKKDSVYLREFLSYCISKKKFPYVGTVCSGVGTGLYMSFFFGGLSVGAWPSSILAGIGAIGLLGVTGWAAAVETKAKNSRPQMMLLNRAAETAEVMQVGLNNKTLARDLGDDTILVLEECARQWARIHTTLNSTLWSSPNLPEHYRAARQRALDSSDQSMCDVILIFEERLKIGPRQRKPMEMIEDVVNEYVFKAQTRNNFTPVGFDRARDMVLPLRQLADQIEKINTQVAEDASLGHAVSKRGLEQSISELRQIEIAEQELRQNLGE